MNEILLFNTYASADEPRKVFIVVMSGHPTK